MSNNAKPRAKKSSTTTTTSRRRPVTKTASKLVAGALKDVVAVIRMEADDTACSYALNTCKDAKFHAVYIIDASRGEREYALQPQIPEMRAMGITVTFLTNDIALLSHFKAYAIMVEIPPDFYAMREHVHRMVEHARVSGVRTTYKRFALAPTYELTPDWTNCFILLLHTFFSLVGAIPFVSSRLYRSTYMQITVLYKQLDVVSLPAELAFNKDKEPFLYGDRGARSKPPPDRKGMSHFLYLARKEKFTIRLWFAMLCYVALICVPFWMLVPPRITSIWNIFDWQWAATLSSIQDLGSNMRFTGWVIHAFASAYLVRTYFDTRGMSYVNALVFPVTAPIFVILVFFARFIWRGYGGEAPVLTIPTMLPRVIAATRYLPPVSSSDEIDNAAASTGMVNDDNDEDDDDNVYSGQSQEGDESDSDNDDEIEEEESDEKVAELTQLRQKDSKKPRLVRTRVKQ